MNAIPYTQIMEYQISHQEIVRRKKAYGTLCLSLLSGLLVFSTIFAFPIAPVGYLSVLITLILLGAFAFHFLEKLAVTKIMLTPQSLIRESNASSEVFPLQQISRVKIKWTTKKTIREMYIWIADGKSIFISALNRPEDFKNDLLGKLGKKVAIEEIHEPLDFDHPLFYSLLGFPVIGVGVGAVKAISRLNYQQMRMIFLAFFVYVFLLGFYFVAAQPLSKRYNSQKKIYDYVVGMLMIGAAITIAMLF